MYRGEEAWSLSNAGIVSKYGDERHGFHLSGTGGNSNEDRGGMGGMMGVWSGCTRRSVLDTGSERNHCNPNRWPCLSKNNRWS